MSFDRYKYNHFLHLSRELNYYSNGRMTECIINVLTKRLRRVFFDFLQPSFNYYTHIQVQFTVNGGDRDAMIRCYRISIMKFRPSRSTSTSSLQILINHRK